MAKIQDKNKYYFFWRRYVDFMFKAAYRRVEYRGQANIPQDGAIIYAPNHTNTLMDALAVLAIDRQAKVFVARADIFKQPTILKLLTFLKMLPINRRRDGIDTLAKNEEIANIVVDVLRDKTPFCILPEGTHHAMHSLMPLQKGIFRIALQANNDFGSRMPVYIVPVGITFGHFFRYRSSLLVQIGKAINVTRFVNQNPQLTAPQQINMLRDTLSDELKKVILHIPDNEHHSATLQLAQLHNQAQQRPLSHRFAAAKATIAHTRALLQSPSPQAQQQLSAASHFARRRHALGISMPSVLSPPPRLSPLARLLFIVPALPCAIVAAAATAPLTLLSLWLCSKFQDKAFHNTVRYLAALVLLPILSLLLGTIAAIALSWPWALLCALLPFPSFFFLHEYLRAIRLFLSDAKWLLHKDLRHKAKGALPIRLQGCRP